jgi:hypothetical protein
LRRGYIILFTLALFAFFSPSLSRLGAWTGGGNLRWVLLPVMGFATVIYQMSNPVNCPRRVLGVLYLFNLYILVTAFWSENPELTFAKWCVFVLAGFMFLLGGTMLASQSAAKNPFNPLAPVYLFAVLTSPLAILIAPGDSWANGLFQGFVNGPNMFGSMLAFSSPWVIP